MTWRIPTVFVENRCEAGPGRRPRRLTIWRSSGSRASTESMSKPLTMVAVSRTGCLLDARGGLLTGDAKQPAQVLPGPGGVAQDVGAVLREPFGSPLRDDDPGHEAAQDQVREQLQLGRGERGDGVVPGAH